MALKSTMLIAPLNVGMLQFAVEYFSQQQEESEERNLSDGDTGRISHL